MNFGARVAAVLFALALSVSAAQSREVKLSERSLSILETGAVGDAATVNTNAIQSAIDHLANEGGGVVIVPSGVFISGALFFKAHVSLRLEHGAVLRCSTDMRNFPPQRTRIEGHIEDHFTPGLINADGCDGFELSGDGILDGAGRPIWDEFWRLRNAATDRANFKNLSVARARLCIIQNSRNVTVSGITFKDSQFWNLHIYNCRGVLIENASFKVPDDYKQAPSSDGIDVDSSQDVTIDHCFFSVTDDCVALKGSKGTRALEDKSSPPVDHVRVRNCLFKRGHSAVTLGSEATIVRDVVLESARIEGPMAVLNLKLRPDTPQLYEDIHFRDIILESDGGTLILAAPWKQFVDLAGDAPPRSVVKNISMTNVHGHFGAFGSIKGNSGQTAISDILFDNIDATFRKPALDTIGVENLVRR